MKAVFPDFDAERTFPSRFALFSAISGGETLQTKVTTGSLRSAFYE